MVLGLGSGPSRQMSLRLTVVLVTFGRPDWLKRCIESLRADAASLPELGLEFQVAVNGQDPESEAVLRSLGISFRTVERGSPAAVRNTLLNDATGEWILFI